MYSLDASRRDASNEYPQHKFSRRNHKTSCPDTILSGTTSTGDDVITMRYLVKCPYNEGPASDQTVQAHSKDAETGLSNLISFTKCFKNAIL